MVYDPNLFARGVTLLSLLCSVCITLSKKMKTYAVLNVWPYPLLIFAELYQVPFIGVTVPIMWFYLLMNVITQYPLHPSAIPSSYVKVTQRRFVFLMARWPEFRVCLDLNCRRQRFPSSLGFWERPESWQRCRRSAGHWAHKAIVVGGVEKSVDNSVLVCDKNALWFLLEFFGSLGHFTSCHKILPEISN